MAKKNSNYFVFPARGSFGDINKAAEDIKDTIYKSVAGLNIESSKSVSITQNGTVTITPSSGKDAMSAVTATVNVNGGSTDLEDNKEVSITENGTVEITPTAGKDGMKKVTATVNVSGGGGTVVYRAYRYRQMVYYLNAGNVLTYFEPLISGDRIETGPYNYTYDENTDELTVNGTIFNRDVSLDLKR